MDKAFKDSDWKLCYERLPKGFLKQVKEQVIANDKTILYKKGNRKGYCFSCHSEVTAWPGQKFKQNYKANCPNCGETCFCFLEDGSAWSADWIENVATLEKGRDGKTVFVRQFRISRHKRPFEKSDLKETARYAVRKGYAAKWACEERCRLGWSSMAPCGYFPFDGWRRQKNVDSEYDKGHVFLLPKDYSEIVAGTALQYLDMAEYMRKARSHYCRPIRHILDFARYPAVEMLWKAGFTFLIGQHEAGNKDSRRICWKQKDVEKALGLPLVELQGMNRAGLSAEWLATYRNLCEDRDKGLVTEKEKRLLRRRIGGAWYSTWRKIAWEVPLEGAMNYVQTSPQKGLRVMRPQDYYDYLQECKKLNLDLKDKSVRFPKDFWAAHERCGKQILWEAGKETREKFAKALEKLLPLAWEGGPFLIRPAGSPEELKEEGKALHHCVGGYAERMAQGGTAIFFVRKADAPDEPFYTLEYRDGRIIQCRTVNNKSYEADEDVHAFCEEWLAWTKKGTKKWTKEKSSQQAAR